MIHKSTLPELECSSLLLKLGSVQVQNRSAKNPRAPCIILQGIFVNFQKQLRFTIPRCLKGRQGDKPLEGAIGKNELETEERSPTAKENGAKPQNPLHSRDEEAHLHLHWRQTPSAPRGGEIFVPEEGGAPGVLRGRAGVLQRRAGDDHRRDPAGVHGGCVVREPPLLPRESLCGPRRRRPGREVPKEVRPVLLHHGNPRPQGRDRHPTQEEIRLRQGQGQEIKERKGLACLMLEPSMLWC